MNKLRIVRSMDEEQVELFLDTKSIAYANHDEHGYAGMQIVEDVATRLSAATGLPLEEE